MENFKEQLNHYMETKETQVEIDAVLKQQLHSKLSQPHKRRWWKLAVPLVAIATMAGVVITLSQHQSTPGSVANIITNSLKPQEALAAALEKTFTLDSLAGTFGLNNDGQLHHLELQHTLRSPEYSNIDGTVQAAADTGSSMNIWKQNNNIKVEESGRDPFFNQPYKNSALLNSDERIICSIEHCQTIAEAQQTALEQTLSDQGMFYPVTSEEMIGDISLEPFTDNLNGPGMYITWSTITPIVHGQMVMTSDSFANGTGMSITGYNSHGMKWYTNQKRDGKYWHRMPMYNHLGDGSNTYYVQILEVNNTDYFGVSDPNVPQTLGRGSMIYKVDFNQNTTTEVLPDVVTQAISNYAILQPIVTRNYYQAIQPALYLLRHINEFGEPTSVTPTTKHDQTVEVMQYALPDTYMAELQTTYSGPHDENAHYTMDIYLDATESQFLGYEVKQDDTSLESLWLDDTVLPDEQANDIFSAEAWQQSIQ